MAVSTTKGLQVWLPLTKDLSNQGIAKVNITNNGATYSSTGGKLGGCYSFNGTSSRLNADYTFSANQFSIACWVKPITFPNNSSWKTILPSKQVKKWQREST